VCLKNQGSNPKAEIAKIVLRFAPLKGGIKKNDFYFWIRARILIAILDFLSALKRIRISVFVLLFFKNGINIPNLKIEITDPNHSLRQRQSELIL